MNWFCRSWTLKTMLWLTLASGLCFYWFSPGRAPQEVEGPWNWDHVTSWLDGPARVDQIITEQRTLESAYPYPWIVPLSLDELRLLQNDPNRKQRVVELQLNVDFEKDSLVIIHH